MRLFIVLCFFTQSCGQSFLKLASEVGDYSTQQFRDIEQARKIASQCDYKKECFKEELSPLTEEFCRLEEYSKRGFISEKECNRQYPYVFFKLFEEGKYTSVEWLNAREKHQKALQKYEKELEYFDEAKEEWDQAQEDWREAVRRYEEGSRGYEKAKEYFDEAGKDYDGAVEDYEEAWEDYEKAKREYLRFQRED